MLNCTLAKVDFDKEILNENTKLYGEIFNKATKEILFSLNSDEYVLVKPFFENGADGFEEAPERGCLELYELCRENSYNRFDVVKVGLSIVIKKTDYDNFLTAYSDARFDEGKSWDGVVYDLSDDGTIIISEDANVIIDEIVDENEVEKEIELNKDEIDADSDDSLNSDDDPFEYTEADTEDFEEYPFNAKKKNKKNSVKKTTVEEYYINQDSAKTAAPVSQSEEPDNHYVENKYENNAYNTNAYTTLYSDAEKRVDKASENRSINRTYTILSEGADIFKSEDEKQKEYGDNELSSPILVAESDRKKESHRHSNANEFTQRQRLDEARLEKAYAKRAQEEAERKLEFQKKEEIIGPVGSDGSKTPTSDGRDVYKRIREQDSSKTDSSESSHGLKMGDHSGRDGSKIRNTTGTSDFGASRARSDEKATDTSEADDAMSSSVYTTNSTFGAARAAKRYVQTVTGVKGLSAHSGGRVTETAISSQFAYAMKSYSVLASGSYKKSAADLNKALGGVASKGRNYSMKRRESNYDMARKLSVKNNWGFEKMSSRSLEDTLAKLRRKSKTGALSEAENLQISALTQMTSRNRLAKTRKFYRNMVVSSAFNEMTKENDNIQQVMYAPNKVLNTYRRVGRYKANAERMVKGLNNTHRAIREASTAARSTRLVKKATKINRRINKLATKKTKTSIGKKLAKIEINRASRTLAKVSAKAAAVGAKAAATSAAAAGTAGAASAAGVGTGIGAVIGAVAPVILIALLIIAIVIFLIFLIAIVMMVLSLFMNYEGEKESFTDTSIGVVWAVLEWRETTWLKNMAKTLDKISDNDIIERHTVKWGFPDEADSGNFEKYFHIEGDMENWSLFKDVSDPSAAAGFFFNPNPDNTDGTYGNGERLDGSIKFRNGYTGDFAWELLNYANVTEDAYPITADFKNFNIEFMDAPSENASKVGRVSNLQEILSMCMVYYSNENDNEAFESTGILGSAMTIRGYINDFYDGVEGVFGFLIDKFEAKFKLNIPEAFLTEEGRTNVKMYSAFCLAAFECSHDVYITAEKTHNGNPLIRYCGESYVGENDGYLPGENSGATDDYEAIVANEDLNSEFDFCAAQIKLTYRFGEAAVYWEGLEERGYGYGDEYYGTFWTDDDLCTCSDGDKEKWIAYAKGDYINGEECDCPGHYFYFCPGHLQIKMCPVVNTFLSKTTLYETVQASFIMDIIQRTTTLFNFKFDDFISTDADDGEGWYSKETRLKTQNMYSLNWEQEYVIPRLSHSIEGAGHTYSAGDPNSVMVKLPENLSTERKNVISVALASVGQIPYKYAGYSSQGTNPDKKDSYIDTGYFPDGLDCSGWANWVFNQVEISLNGRSCAAILGANGSISKSSLAPGDLIIKNATAGTATSSENHVKLFIGWNNDGTAVTVECGGAGRNVVRNGDGTIQSSRISSKWAEAYNEIYHILSDGHYKYQKYALKASEGYVRYNPSDDISGYAYAVRPASYTEPPFKFD